MTKNKYIRISPAQAVWVNQSGRTVFIKANESQFFPVENNKELKKNQYFYIALSKQQMEKELDLKSKYQTSMTMNSLLNMIATVLLMFNHDASINTMMVSLGFVWLYTSKNIIVKTIKFNQEQSKCKSFYIYGKVYF